MLAFGPDDFAPSPHPDPMRPSRSIILTLLAAVVLAGATACENGPPWGQREEATQAETPHDFGPTAAYSRRLIFLGPGEQLPTAAVFDFIALSDSASVRHGVRARLLLDNEWVSLLDDGWESEAMREPWRLVPGRTLRIVVDDAGEIAAVAHRGEPSVRLSPGPLVAESSPDAGTQFVLRQATLDIDDEAVRGILLDSKLGRAVSPSALPRPSLEGDGAPEEQDDQGDQDEPAAGEAQDTSAADGLATPIARAGAEAFLVNNSGYYAVFAMSSAGAIGWVSHAGRDEIQRGVALEPLAWSSSEGDAIQMPTRWRIGGPGAQLSGELTAAATAPAPLPGLEELTGLGYILVSGWIEDGGVRRDVFGVVRQVR